MFVGDVAMKINRYLSIVAMCLAIGAIVIGIYSLTSAHVTILGSIGFISHNYGIKAVAYMYGHSSGSTLDEVEQGIPVSEEDKVLLVTETIKGSTQVDLPTYTYFSTDESSNTPQDITILIELSAENSLSRDIVVEAGYELNEKITIKIDGSTQKQAKIINHNNSTLGTATTQTLLYTISLNPNSEGGYSTLQELTNLQLNIEFEEYKTKSNVYISKFSADYVAQLREEFSTPDEYLTYADSFPYYIEMGTKSGETTKLKWLVVGVDDGNGTLINLKEADLIAMQNNSLILTRDYYILSEKNLLRTTYSDEIFPKDVVLGDYKVSTARNKLKTDFLTNYTFTDDEKAIIQPRELKELYADNPPSDDPLSDVSSSTETDDFWLLSYTEALNIFGGSEYVYDENICYASALPKVMETATTERSWVLRTPTGGYNVYGFAGGVLLSGMTTDGDYSLRPACKI